MSDYKAEAERLKEAFERYDDDAESDLIAALEVAEKRGRVAGLREAADYVISESNKGLYGVRYLAQEFRDRAEEVEKS